MGTRALVARSEGSAWKGVWNNWGSQPGDLGNYLLRECERRGGDLSGLIRDVIDTVPGGWSKLQKGSRSPDFSWPPYHGPDELREFSDDIDFVYIFRPRQSCLEVYRVDGDAPLKLVDSVSFDEAGRPSRLFE